MYYAYVCIAQRVRCACLCISVFQDQDYHEVWGRVREFQVSFVSVSTGYELRITTNYLQSVESAEFWHI